MGSGLFKIISGKIQIYIKNSHNQGNHLSIFTIIQVKKHHKQGLQKNKKPHKRLSRN